MNLNSQLRVQIYVVLRKSARKLSLFFYLMILFRLKCMPKITKMPYLAFWAGKCCNKFPVGLFCLIELCCIIVCGMEKCGCREMTWRGSDSKQQAASRRLSLSSSLCQPNGSGHQGSMCWISIHATTLMLMCSRMTLDDTDNLWLWFCVLPQVAWWGKGHLYVFMVTFDALCPPFTNDADSFRFCIILGTSLRI